MHNPKNSPRPIYLHSQNLNFSNLHIKTRTKFNIKNIRSLANRKIKTQINEHQISIKQSHQQKNIHKFNHKQLTNRQDKQNQGDGSEERERQDNEGEETCENFGQDVGVQKVRLLGVYRIGGNSIVYKGVAGGMKNGIEVVVKKIPVDLDHKSRQQYFSTILKNPFIVQCIGSYKSEQPKNSASPTQYLNLILKKYNNNLDEIIQLDTLDPPRLKIYLYQMLRSLVYLHSLNICHRDIKPHNFVIKNNHISLCDFGSAKIISHSNHRYQQNYPKSVVYIFQRQYRAPELLFGFDQYDQMVDIWALGCVAAEMIIKKPLFNGANNLDQIVKILKIIGTPKWVNLSFCKGRIPKLPQIKGIGFEEALGYKTDPLLIDLLQKILRIEPKERISALQALCEPYFDEIRDESFYRTNLRSTNIPNLYEFSKRQISGKQELLTKLVPYWIKEHCKRFQIKIKDYKF